MKGIKTKAFTLIEVLLIVAIIGTLSALLVPSFTNLLEKARVNHTITDVVKISRELDDYLIDNGTLPETLVELIQDSAPLELIDPYGNPYEYLVIFGKRKQDVQGKWRKDRFLVPVNSDYDLYSMGKDEDSQAAFTARASRDDIVRANDGQFFGLAIKY